MPPPECPTGRSGSPGSAPASASARRTARSTAAESAPTLRSASSDESSAMPYTLLVMSLVSVPAVNVKSTVPPM
ncbi:hypothetical protein [Agromyces sp. CCNWLW203]|uniref:hypothetical protein n=1 Tax=Agromyces sp. CCNWLW203 TaxID=3112842 RepID=UPI002F963D39